MSAWGKGGSASSCDALLKRVEENDASLVELVILSNKTFGAPQVERLANAIATGRNTHLVSLSASGHALVPQSLHDLGAAISKRQSALLKLAIGDSRMGDQGVIALCTGLGENGGGLQLLDLEWKDISKDGMEALGKCLGPSETLEKLNLSRNARIQDHGLVAFCTSRQPGQVLLPSLTMLQELNLAECGIGAVGIESMVEMFCKGNSSSLSLTLSGNPLGPDACCALASLLCDTPLLSSLSLANCKIRNEGISILSAAVGMESCNGLTMLDLSTNEITENGAKSLASSLAEWTRLDDLRLAGNELTETGIIALIGALAFQNRRLQSLDLTETACGVQGAVEAVKCQRVSSLRLFNNKLGSEGFEALVPLLKGGHSSLVTLDLGGNNASEGAVVALLTAIADTSSDESFVSTLRVLEIGGNQGGHAVEEAVEKLKQVHPELDVARDRPRGQQQQSGA